jgi:hypothetical protein
MRGGFILDKAKKKEKRGISQAKEFSSFPRKVFIRASFMIIESMAQAL